MLQILAQKSSPLHCVYYKWLSWHLDHVPPAFKRAIIIDPILKEPTLDTSTSMLASVASFFSFLHMLYTISSLSYTEQPSRFKLIGLEGGTLKQLAMQLLLKTFMLLYQLNYHWSSFFLTFQQHSKVNHKSLLSILISLEIVSYQEGWSYQVTSKWSTCAPCRLSTGVSLGPVLSGSSVPLLYPLSQWSHILAWVLISLPCWWPSTHPLLCALRLRCLCSDRSMSFRPILSWMATEIKSQHDWPAIFTWTCNPMLSSCDLPRKHSNHTFWHCMHPCVVLDNQMSFSPYSASRIRSCKLLLYMIQMIQPF